MKKPTSTSSTSPEHWLFDTGSDSVAVLNIPGLNGRARVFDVDATLLVNVPADPEGAWLERTSRVRLEAEQGLRVRAVAAVKGVRIRQLVVEAREDA